MEKTVTVCDTCEDPSRSVKKYQIRESTRKTEATLCSEHAAPLEKWLDAKPVQIRKRSRAKVVPFEEVAKHRTQS